MLQQQAAAPPTPQGAPGAARTTVAYSLPKASGQRSFTENHPQLPWRPPPTSAAEEEAAPAEEPAAAQPAEPSIAPPQWQREAAEAVAKQNPSTEEPYYPSEYFREREIHKNKKKDNTYFKYYDKKDKSIERSKELIRRAREQMGLS